MKSKDEIKLEIYELAQKISRASSEKFLTETAKEMYDKTVLLKYAADITSVPPTPAAPVPVAAVEDAPKAEIPNLKQTTIDLFSAEPQAESPAAPSLPEPAAEPVVVPVAEVPPPPKETKESKKKKEETMVERLQHKRIQDMKAAIGINEKFQFINELFEGNMKEYNVAVDQINNFSSNEEAESYISNLETVYKWQPDNQIAENFKELVERRFA